MQVKVQRDQLEEGSDSSRWCEFLKYILHPTRLRLMAPRGWGQKMGSGEGGQNWRVAFERA